MLKLPGSELYWDMSLGFAERWYCRLLGVPIVGLRIRLRRLLKLLPERATAILDAGCGRGVIARQVARRYPDAAVDAIDENASVQDMNRRISESLGISNCNFITGDLLNYQKQNFYDLIFSVDNLEHIQDDLAVLGNFYQSLQENGVLIVHVPHYYRRWPVFAWHRNFDVPGHVRPGYHLPELTERVRRVGFTIQSQGFSYGWLENLVNNISFSITAAKERRKFLYAVFFPLLNLLAWAGRWSRPKMGAGVWVIAEKKQLAV